MDVGVCEPPINKLIADKMKYPPHTAVITERCQNTKTKENKVNISDKYYQQTNNNKIISRQQQFENEPMIAGRTKAQAKAPQRIIVKTMNNHRTHEISIKPDVIVSKKKKEEKNKKRTKKYHSRDPFLE